MTLSTADIKGSLVGVGYILVAMLVVNVALYFLAYEYMIVLTETLMGVVVTIACFLAIAGVFSAALAVIGLVLRFFRR
jgi:hypothetical protein